MKKILVALPLIGALMLAGCAGTDTKATEVSETPFPEIIDNGELIAVKDRFVAEGFECESWSIGNPFQLATASGTCEKAVRIGYFEDPKDIDKQVEASRNWAKEHKLEKSSWVVGDDWIIETKEPKLVVKKLGGKVITI
ncbi:hypothetical protein CGQ24_11860 [Arthrobacter sp. 7749]|nr:hypothetical protein CGQ24_11860 [Arthrobacter sp. 7749]